MNEENIEKEETRPGVENAPYAVADSGGAMEKCEAERKEYLEGWQRARADYSNYKKDETRRLEDAMRVLVSRLTLEMLPVLDSFDFALESVTRAADRNRKNEEQVLLLIRSQFLDFLKRRGIEPIKIEAGEPLLQNWKCKDRGFLQIRYCYFQE